LLASSTTSNGIESYFKILSVTQYRFFRDESGELPVVIAFHTDYFLAPDNSFFTFSASKGASQTICKSFVGFSKYFAASKTAPFVEPKKTTTFSLRVAVSFDRLFYWHFLLDAFVLAIFCRAWL